MSSNSGKYLISFAVIIVILNIGLVLTLVFQDYIKPKKATSTTTVEIVSIPVSSPSSL